MLDDAVVFLFFQGVKSANSELFKDFYNAEKMKKNKSDDSIYFSSASPMQQLGNTRYREKRGQPTFISPALFIPKAAISKYYRGRSSDLLHFSAAFPSAEGGQWLLGSKKAFSGANSIG